MLRRLLGFGVILMILVLVGCGSVGKSLIAKEEWSENYAAAKGVEATAPEMVDGNRRTVGETQSLSGGRGRGTGDFTEAVVKLPEKKAIRKIVIYTTNLENFSVYSGGKDKGSWKGLAEFKNNSDKVITLNVSVVTDRIRIRVRSIIILCITTSHILTHQYSTFFSNAKIKYKKPDRDGRAYQFHFNFISNQFNPTAQPELRPPRHLCQHSAAVPSPSPVPRICTFDQRSDRQHWSA